MEEESRIKYISKLNARKKVMEKMHDEFICEVHNKRIFNCELKNNFEIYYEACCMDFSVFIGKELDKNAF